LGAKTTVRKVLNIRLEERAGSALEFEIESTGFLKGMVRLTVGTLVHVGKERITPDDFGKVLQSGVKTHFVRSAPPWGLYLKEVKY
ncbi:MAG: tRNA pseudouridine(38-40) synthase TruA, partial [Thermodesulfobacteriota bacterium]